MKKKVIIGAVILVAVAGAAGLRLSGGKQGEQLPQVEVVRASLGDVQQTVDASGTVVSDEQKIYFSPVNARIKGMSFEAGDSVKAGTKLVEFDLEDLEKNNERAALNLESGMANFQNAVNKSDKAVQKQTDAKSRVAVLEQKVRDQKNYVAALKSQLSSVTAQAQRNAQAQTAAAQAEAQRQAEAEQFAREEALREQQQAYAAALTTYQNETLPAYQQELEALGGAANQALNDYNQADTAYQMAFAAWQAVPDDANAEALTAAEQRRSQAQIAYQSAQSTYEAKKTQPPAMPALNDFSGEDSVWDFISDGTDVDNGVSTEQGTGISPAETGSYAAPDTSGIEAALEAASSDLAELQSELASEKAVAEADAAGMTEEEKKQMEITNNLTEMDAKSAEELVEEAKKGICADFNGVISKVSIEQGATVSQGMELFTIQNTDEVSVDINVSKYDYDKLQENQKAEITLAGNTYEGTVAKISHIAVPNEKGTPVVAAEVKIENPDKNIFLGVDAKVKIQAAEAKNVVVLPLEVVNIGKNGSFCYVLENGIITRKDIQTGISSADYVEVTDGLKVGDQVIYDLGTLEEGMPAETIDTENDDAETADTDVVKMQDSEDKSSAAEEGTDE